jgi:hypothetical protein
MFALALACGSCAAKEETLDELKARAQNAPVDQRPELCVKIAEQEFRNADKFYNDGQVEEARTAVGDVVTYTEKARDFAIQTKKHIKNVEIDARKMAQRLRDLKRTLAFEDQAPVEQAIRKLEDIRTALLQEMFSNKNEKKDKK